MAHAGERRFKVRQAASILGVPASTLRTWERRYAVAAPERSEGGQRLYGDRDLAALASMRDLVLDGMAPAAAAAAALQAIDQHDPGREPDLDPNLDPDPDPDPDLDPDLDRAHDRDRDREDEGGPAARQPSFSVGAHHATALVAAAARWDVAGAKRWLDEGFALGPFEQIVDTWLMPALVALGEAERDRVIATSACQAIAHAVLRRLAVAYDQAGTGWRPHRVVVGLAGGAHHELGALAFATLLRRRGLQTLYLGPDVPLAGWTAGVSGWAADAAVLAVPRYDDRADARVTATALRRNPALLVAAGGGAATGLLDGVHTVGPSLRAAAEQLDRLLVSGAH